MPQPEVPMRRDARRWPPCARAQADGVPCQELGRDCEQCAEAYPDLTTTVEAPRNEATARKR